MNLKHFVVRGGGALEMRVRALHSRGVPEIISGLVLAGPPASLAWVSAGCDIDVKSGLRILER